MEKKETKEKTTYQKIKDGEKLPEGSEKGWNNLRPDKYNFAVIDQEKRKEICRKGAAAVNKLHGEKKSAKQALENILSLKVTDEIIAGADLPPEIAERLKRDNPNATMYDLIQLVAVGRAVGGNVKAMEYVRDTNGDAPKLSVDVSGSVTTDQDRQLLQQINERLQNVEMIQVIDDQ